MKTKKRKRKRKVKNCCSICGKPFPKIRCGTCGKMLPATLEYWSPKALEHYGIVCVDTSDPNQEVVIK